MVGGVDSGDVVTLGWLLVTTGGALASAGFSLLEAAKGKDPKRDGHTSRRSRSRLRSQTWHHERARQEGAR
jgi:hypothetical protein